MPSSSTRQNSRPPATTRTKKSLFSILFPLAQLPPYLFSDSDMRKTFCSTRSWGLPAEPMYTTAGRRR